MAIIRLLAIVHDPLHKVYSNPIGKTIVSYS